MAESGGLIVVGVDGSPDARRALDWALSEARLRGGRCLLVHAYEFGIVAPVPFAAPEYEYIRAVEETLDEELAFARGSGVPVEGRTVLGGAAKALIDASQDADLLVVGSRGKGGFRGALLGSVSTACVHHAACPIVVIPPPDRLHAAARD
jgi:nucleotide-binding universal stress UspA family protein